MIAELLPYLEDLLALGHMGVVVRMAEVAVRFVIKQKKMLKALLRAFHCEGKVERNSAVVLISSLTTYEIFYGTKPEPDEKEKVSEENSNSVVSLAVLSVRRGTCGRATGILLWMASNSAKQISKINPGLLLLSDG